MMHIGVDFDNTIVSYDTLFHKVAAEQAAIPAGLPRSKLAVRDYLRSVDKEHIWTEMQGYVYGARMDEAEAYPGAVEFLRWAAGQGVAVSIISHKTRHPYIGPKYDLHVAARGWVDRHLRDDAGRALVQAQNVHFELTKEEKLRRILTAGCDHYIDDLPEILLAEGFPKSTQCILFDPESHHGPAPRITCMRSWADVLSHFEQAWLTR
jgi:hypothetical protein